MLQSMTGFSRQSGDCALGSYTWECRSVNGKSLDVRMRLAHGFEEIEAAVRTKVQKAFGRGSINLNLGFEAGTQAKQLEINHGLVEQLITASKTMLEKDPTIAPLTMDGLLATRGVVELTETKVDETDRKAMHLAVLEGLDKALEILSQSRAQEGEKISLILEGQLAEIERLTAAIENDPSRSAEAIREKLQARLHEIFELSEDKLNQDRLYQEAAMLALKSDLAEEVDRLHAHVEKARELLQSDKPVGRELDFLCQEFNRECNTICSKANGESVTRFGLEMKVIIDRFREQVQNIE